MFSLSSYDGYCYGLKKCGWYLVAAELGEGPALEAGTGNSPDGHPG
jgi:hypothetical protein